MSSISYSQSGEDLIILFLVQHVLHLRDVYYLDVGANDPTEFNNTQALYEAGFRGVSVDANPFFTKLYKKLRPDDTFVPAGVGSKKGTQVFYEIDPHTLSTFSKEEAESYTASGIHKITNTYKCPILPVQDVIKKYCKSQPNVLSLDVEGLDLDVLQSIDFSKWRPAVICVETLTYDTEGNGIKIKEIIDFLSNNGYSIYADTYINSIFVSKEAWDAK